MITTSYLYYEFQIRYLELQNASLLPLISKTRDFLDILFYCRLQKTIMKTLFYLFFCYDSSARIQYKKRLFLLLFSANFLGMPPRRVY